MKFELSIYSGMEGVEVKERQQPEKRWQATGLQNCVGLSCFTVSGGLQGCFFFLLLLKKYNCMLTWCLGGRRVSPYVEVPGKPKQ